MIDVLHGHYYIMCPTKKEAYDLFQVFENLRLEWAGHEPLSITHWESCGQNTYYHLDHGKIKYGDKATDYDRSLVRNCLLGAKNDITFIASEFIRLFLEQEQEINNLELII